MTLNSLMALISLMGSAVGKRYVCYDDISRNAA